MFLTFSYNTRIQFFNFRSITSSRVARLPMHSKKLTIASRNNLRGFLSGRDAFYYILHYMSMLAMYSYLVNQTFLLAQDVIACSISVFLRGRLAIL